MLRFSSFDPDKDDELLALDALQSHIANRLSALISNAQPQGPALSFSFLYKLLDAKASSDGTFRAFSTSG